MRLTMGKLDTQRRRIDYSPLSAASALVGMVVVAVVFWHLAQHPAATVRTPTVQPKRESCVPYPPFPDTIICDGRWMYHLQKGGRALMADLWKKPQGTPTPKPVVPLN